MDGSTWTNAGTALSYNFNDPITALKGTRTVYLKAMGDSNHFDSGVTTKNVNVYQVKLSGDSGVNNLKLNGTAGAAGSSFVRNFIKGRKITIEAVTKPNFRFYHWLENN